MPMTNNTIAHIAHLLYCHSSDDRYKTENMCPHRDKTLSSIINLLQRSKNLCSLSLRFQRSNVASRPIEIEILSRYGTTKIHFVRSQNCRWFVAAQLCHKNNQWNDRLWKIEKTRKLLRKNVYAFCLCLTQFSVIERACARFRDDNRYKLRICIHV